ncbi:MAG: cyclic-di-AMP receptor [Erysipelotrichaceae bacterium]
MKLILAIISKDDSHEVTNVLTKAEYQVTKLASTGGFLRNGNTTLLVGCDDEKVEEAIKLIGDNAQSRMEVVSTATSYDMSNLITFPIEVKVGGATIFVINVDQFVKL